MTAASSPDVRQLLASATSALQDPGVNTASRASVGGPAGVASEGLPHDIEELRPYRPGLRDYAPQLLVGGVILLVLSSAAILAWRRWRRAKPGPSVDPWQTLEQQLAVLTIEAPFDLSAREETFYRMSLLLREAIELKLSLRATDLTLHELKEPLRRDLPLPAATTEQILEFLARADLVKFAEAPASRSEAEEAKTQIIGWIQSLRQAAHTVQPSGEASSELFSQASGHGEVNTASSSSIQHVDHSQPLPGLPSQRLGDEEVRRAPR